MERGAIKEGALYWEVDLISIPALSEKKLAKLRKKYCTNQEEDTDRENGR